MADRSAPGDLGLPEGLEDLLGGPVEITGAQGANVPQGASIRKVEFAEAGNVEKRAAGNIDLLLDVPLELTVELGRTSMSIRSILSLGSGSVVELQKLAGEPVDILINNRPIATGEVVVVDDNFGVRIADILDPKKRIESLR